MTADAAAPETASDAPEDDRRYRAPALEKGLDILELMASHGGAMTASQISARLQRSMSELFRMIQVLEYKGYITPAEAGGYELSNKLFTLGMSRAPVRSLLESALPVMRELADRLQQSCHLAVASNEQMVVVARVENSGQLGFTVRPGYRRSLAATTSGAVLFTFQPEQVRNLWVERLRAAGTEEALIARLVHRADEVRSAGYASAASEFVEGITDISAPVRAGAGCAAALTIPFVRSIPPPCTIEEATRELCAAADRISAELGTAL